MSNLVNVKKEVVEGLKNTALIRRQDLLARRQEHMNVIQALNQEIVGINELLASFDEEKEQTSENETNDKKELDKQE